MQNFEHNLQEPNHGYNGTSGVSIIIIAVLSYHIHVYSFS